jgi:hypothetical protein
MRQASFIDSVASFHNSILKSVDRLGLVKTPLTSILFDSLAEASIYWADGDEVGAVFLLVDCFDTAKKKIADAKRALKRAGSCDTSKLEAEIRAEVNAFQGARGNKFYKELRRFLDEALRGAIVEAFVEGGVVLTPRHLSDIKTAEEVLKDRGIHHPLAVLDIAKLQVAIEQATPTMKRIPARQVEAFLAELPDTIQAHIVDSVRAEYKDCSLFDQLGDILAWVGAIAWHEPFHWTLGLSLKDACRFMESVVIWGRRELSTVAELARYTNHPEAELEEWLQDERSLDNDETDLIPLLEEYFYHVEGVYPDHMGYAVDAVEQGIVPDIFEAVEWIQSNMLGIYESTTDYAQQVLDEMENPDNLPLIKAEDYWEKELRYDISVLENESIKLLLVRS